MTIFNSYVSSYVSLPEVFFLVLWSLVSSLGGQPPRNAFQLTEFSSGTLSHLRYSRPKEMGCWPLKLPYFAGWWFGCHFLFSHILGIVIPIDFHIFQRGGPGPPTSLILMYLFRHNTHGFVSIQRTPNVIVHLKCLS